MKRALFPLCIAAVLAGSGCSLFSVQKEQKNDYVGQQPSAPVKMPKLKRTHSSGMATANMKANADVAGTRLKQAKTP